MTWADFYLICFAVGFLFSLLSFLAGGLRWHLHLPHFSHVHLAPPQAVAGHGAPATSLSAGPADGGKAVVHHPTAHLSPFNVLGRISVSIRHKGTGEIIYSQAGTRRTCGARGEDGNAIPKGTEVVVTRYEKGIAFVRPWTEISGEEDSR